MLWFIEKIVQYIGFNSLHGATPNSHPSIKFKLQRFKKKLNFAFAQSNRWSVSDRQLKSRSDPLIRSSLAPLALSASPAPNNRNFYIIIVNTPCGAEGARSILYAPPPHTHTPTHTGGHIKEAAAAAARYPEILRSSNFGLQHKLPRVYGYPYWPSANFYAVGRSVGAAKLLLQLWRVICQRLSSTRYFSPFSEPRSHGTLGVIILWPLGIMASWVPS